MQLLLAWAIRASLRMTSSDLFWFRQARFGVSFHWGVASAPGRGDGWLRSAEKMPLADYDAFFDGFRPAPDWAARWATTDAERTAFFAPLDAERHRACEARVPTP